MRRAIVFSVIIFMAAFIVSNAQPRRTPKDRAQNLKEQLNLTDEQTSKIENLYIEADKKFQEAAQVNLDRSKFREIMDSTNVQIKKLLTDEQKDTFNKLLEERRNRMSHNRQNGSSN
jgi:periplasmic protein CpxP/Spy